MDQLDLLKKDWKKQDASLPKYSQSELSKLIHKKSSSVVKWIFIISILELVLPNLIAILTGSGNGLSLQLAEEFQTENLQTFINVFYAIFYGFAIYFIFRFYKNYKAISATSSTKDLMQSIIKARKTVKYYIWIGLGFASIFISVIFYNIFTSEGFIEQLPENTNMVILWIIIVLLTIFSLGLIWLFYMLIYGFLLRKLKLNYQELIKDGNGNL